MKKHVFLVLTLATAKLFLAYPVAAESGIEAKVLWQETFSGSYYSRPEEHRSDILDDVAVFPDGGVAGLLTVRQKRYERGIRTAVRIVRMDSLGRMLWDRSYERTENLFTSQQGRAIAVLSDGGLAVVGHGSSTARDGFWVLRLDRSGGTLWRAALAGERNGIVYDIDAWPNGDVVVGARVRAKEAPDDDAWVVRLGPDGRVVWEATFDRGDDEWVYNVRALRDGGVLVAGFFWNRRGEETRFDLRVFRLDAKGGIVWERVFPNRDILGDAYLAADGGFVICQFPETGSSAGEEIVVRRFGPAGNRRWQRRVRFWDAAPEPAAERQYVGACAELAGGGLAVGVYRHFDIPLDDYMKVKQTWLGRFDPAGRRLWTRPVAGHGPNPVRAVTLYVTPRPDGGFVTHGLNATHPMGGWRHRVWIDAVPPR